MKSFRNLIIVVPSFRILIYLKTFRVYVYRYPGQKNIQTGPFTSYSSFNLRRSTSFRFSQVLRWKMLFECECCFATWCIFSCVFEECQCFKIYKLPLFSIPTLIFKHLAKGIYTFSVKELEICSSEWGRTQNTNTSLVEILLKIQVKQIQI